MLTWSSTQRLEESKCHSYLKKVQERGPRELQAGQPHLDPWEGDGAPSPGNHFQIHDQEENHQLSSEGINEGEVVFDQLDNFL